MYFPAVQKETPADVELSARLRETPLGEYLSAKLESGLDWTSVKRLWDEISIPGEMPLAASEMDVLVGLGIEGQPLPEQRKLTRDEWEASEHYRDGIPYREDLTVGRAQAQAERFDQRRYRESLVERSPFGFRSILGFGAAMLGGAVDPINYLPFLGPVNRARAIARFGEVGGRALVSAAEAAIGTAVVDPLVIASLRGEGEDVGWQDAALDIVFGAAVGSVFGAASGVLHQHRVAALRRRLAMPDREVLGRAAEKAVADLAEDTPVDVAGVLGQQRAFRKVYDVTLNQPVGDPHYPFVILESPEFGESLRQVVVERGPARFDDAGEVQIVGRGFGLVKIIWKHGEKSGKLLQVTKDDVLALPKVLAEYESHEFSPGKYELAVPRSDGHKIIYAISTFTGTDGLNHLVSIHVEEPGRTIKTPFSNRKTAGTESTTGRLSPSRKGTPEGTSVRPSRGRAAVEDIVSNRNDGDKGIDGDIWRTERKNEVAHVPPADRGFDAKTDPETAGILPEHQAIIDRMEQAGELTDQDRADLAEAKDVAERAEKYEEAMLAAVECVMR